MASGDGLECPQCGGPVWLPEYADLVECVFCGSTLVRRGKRDLTNGALTAPPEERQVLRSVSCPQCGGPLDAREGRRVLQCDSCGARVAVRTQGGFSRWFFPAGIDYHGAAGCAAAWLRDYPGLSRAARRACLEEVRLYYAPIWEYRTLLAGWEFGRKFRTRAEVIRPFPVLAGDGVLPGQGEYLKLGLVEESVAEGRLQERRFYQAAADLEILGATRPRVTGRELLLPLLAGELEPEAVVLEAVGSVADVAQRGRRSVLTPMSGAFSSDDHFFVFRESVALLYYPLWLVCFRAGARSCRVIVNGRNGDISSGFAPASNRKRVILLGLQAAAALVVAGFLVWLGATGAAPQVAMIIVAAIVFVAGVAPLRGFRGTAEVEYHEPFSG